jgi:hypothetical protein
MRANLLLAALMLAGLTGCTDQVLRPCGPGYLGNILIPQGFIGVDFRPACRRHDNCYGSNCPRKACDDRFLNDMLGACECSPLPGLCKLKAYQWYWQVRLFGGPGYSSSQRQRARCGGGCGGQCGCGQCGEACGCGACGCGVCGGCASGGCAAQGCAAPSCSRCGCGAPSGCCSGGQAVLPDDAPLENYSYQAEAMAHDDAPARH